MTSGQISSGLDLTYAPSTITTQQPTEGELDLFFEAMYDDYIGGQPSATARTVLAAQAQQVHQTQSQRDLHRNTTLDRVEVLGMIDKRSNDSGFELTGFLDADYAGCKDTFKSTSGGAQFLRKKLVSWPSKKQDCTALSTAKSEYMSLSACCAQVLWMQTQLMDYGFHFNKIPIYCDSKSAIAISCNPVQHSRTKHIAVRYHFIKEHVEKGTTELYFVKTDYQLADIFTKALPANRFNYLVCRLCMRSLPPKELERLTKSQ
nr:retrovirus-related Pol polyprotein from transposon TNT 1-94 [Tanacetum cinerariifolium]